MQSNQDITGHLENRLNPLGFEAVSVFFVGIIRTNQDKSGHDSDIFALQFVLNCFAICTFFSDDFLCGGFFKSGSRRGLRPIQVFRRETFLEPHLHF